MDETMEAFRKLDADLRRAARNMGLREARWVVKTYYTIQDCRTRSANQVRGFLNKDAPNGFVEWSADLFRLGEHNIKRGLDEFTKEFTVSRWMRSLVGVGPVISAGILTNFDVRKAPCAGNFWRFAGLDPTRQWQGKKWAEADVNEKFSDLKLRQKITTQRLMEYADHHKFRWESAVKYFKGNATPTKEQLIKYMSLCPYNQDLKTLCNRIADCFVKFKNHENDYYGAIYDRRKAYETEKNERREYAKQAEETMASRRAPGPSTDAYKYYMDGRLPPGRIHLRAMRYTVKIFLSHVHHVMFEDYYDRQPPNPFPLSKPGSQHTHFIPIPNYPLPAEVKMRSLKELLVDTPEPEPPQEDGEGGVDLYEEE